MQIRIFEVRLSGMRRFFRSFWRRCGYHYLPRYHIACLAPPLKGWDCGKRCVQKRTIWEGCEAPHKSPITISGLKVHSPIFKSLRRVYTNKQTKKQLKNMWKKTQKPCFANIRIGLYLSFKLGCFQRQLRLAQIQNVPLPNSRFFGFIENSSKTQLNALRKVLAVFTKRRTVFLFHAHPKMIYHHWEKAG